jgi:hypothetical protein
VKKQQLSREEIIEQWLDLYPIRQHEYESDDEGTITILVPHSENWITRKLLPRPKNPAQRIHLDDTGSLVWNLFDGQHSIRNICEELSRRSQNPEQSIEERTVLFAQQMYKQQFIKVFTKKGESDSGTLSDNTP